MARDILSSLVTDIEAITQVTDQDTLLKRELQRGLDFIASEWDWPYLNTRGFFTTIAPYETGTVAITKGLKALVGTDTVFTAAMEGRKIRIDGTDVFYTLDTHTDATHFTIKEPFQDTTVTAGEISIFKNEYRLAPDVDRYKLLRWMDDGNVIFDIQPNSFDLSFPDQNDEGDPFVSSPIGTKPEDTNTTGTLSGTVNLKALTGVGTTWLSVEGLGRGSEISIQDAAGSFQELVTVKSVDSDTTITIYEKLTATVAGVGFTIHLDNIVIILHSIPDAVGNIYYRYQRKVAPFVNDEDRPDMPRNWTWVLKEYGKISMWDFKADESKKQQTVQLVTAGLGEMKAKVGYVSRGRTYPKKSMDTARSARRGRLPSEFDIKYSL